MEWFLSSLAALGIFMVLGGALIISFGGICGMTLGWKNFEKSCENKGLLIFGWGGLILFGSGFLVAFWFLFGLLI